MVLPIDPTAPIRFSDIRNEFGGTAPDRLSEYYRGDGLVPNDAGDAVIGVTEVQTIVPSGTRSNVVGAGAGNNEFLQIALPDNFDSGTTAVDMTGTFVAGQGTGVPGDSISWSRWFHEYH